MSYQRVQERDDFIDREIYKREWRSLSKEDQADYNFSFENFYGRLTLTNPTTSTESGEIQLS